MKTNGWLINTSCFLVKWRGYYMKYSGSFCGGAVKMYFLEMQEMMNWNRSVRLHAHFTLYCDQGNNKKAE